MSTLLILVLASVPFITLGCAVFIGPARAAAITAGICLLLLIAPYLYFGVWGLWRGAGLWSTWSLVAQSWPGMQTILAAITVWSAIGIVFGGLFRFGWTLWKRSMA